VRKPTLILYFLLIFSAFSYARQPANDSVIVFLDKSLAILQANAINRDSVDWTALRATVYEKAASAQNYEEAAKVFPYIFEQIGDHHGALRIGKKSYDWNSGFSYQNNAVKEAVKTWKKVSVKLLKGNIGYVLLPGNNDFSGKNIDIDAKEIRAALASLKSKKIKGWILDLRVNTGGSMYQMLAGLSPILGEGKLGSFINQHGKNDGSWIIRNGNIYLDSNKVSNLPETPVNRKKSLPLAVLISGMTASSGEVVAISTIGRKNAVLIGEPTAGYTTANEGFKINAVAGLNLAVDYDGDRNGKIYSTKVTPVITIDGGDNFADPALDLKVISASKWINGKH